jgi:hypothetical protein
VTFVKCVKVSIDKSYSVIRTRCNARYGFGYDKQDICVVI